MNRTHPSKSPFFFKTATLCALFFCFYAIVVLPAHHHADLKTNSTCAICIAQDQTADIAAPFFLLFFAACVLFIVQLIIRFSQYEIVPICQSSRAPPAQCGFFPSDCTGRYLYAPASFKLIL
jgi:hypothetical protein